MAKGDSVPQFSPKEDIEESVKRFITLSPHNVLSGWYWVSTNNRFGATFTLFFLFF